MFIILGIGGRVRLYQAAHAGKTRVKMAVAFMVVGAFIVARTMTVLTEYLILGVWSAVRILFSLPSSPEPVFLFPSAIDVTHQIPVPGGKSFRIISFN